MGEERMPARSTAGHFAGSAGRVPHQYLRSSVQSAMEEILGRDEVNTVLARASDASPSLDHSANGTGFGWGKEKDSMPQVDALLMALEVVYGAQGGRGLALRIGQACFRYALREYGTRVSTVDQAFRLLPLPSRIRSTLRWLAQVLNEQMGQDIRLEDQGDQLIWRIERCPLCGQRESMEPICYPAVGLLQEALYGLSGGRIFRVEEIVCRAQGDSACSFSIDSAPIA